MKCFGQQVFSPVRLTSGKRGGTLQEWGTPVNRKWLLGFFFLARIYPSKPE